MEGIELFNGTYYQASDSQFALLEFKRYLFTLNLPDKAKLLTDPYTMSLSTLFKMYDINNHKIQSVINQKIVWPLYSLLFIFLSFNLDWYLSYINYSRDSNKIWIPLTICIIISVVHFLIQNLGKITPIGGLIAIYLFPVIIYLSIKILTRNKFK